MKIVKNTENINFKAIPGYEIRIWISITGLVLFSFIIVHLFGNILILFGRQVFDDYVEKLHSAPTILFFLRLALVVCFVIHIGAITVLSRKNQEARLIDYNKVTVLGALPESYTAQRSGKIILLFLVFHLLHVKLFKHDDLTLSGSLYEQFKPFPIVILYVFSLWQLKKHLSYSLVGIMQTMGILNRKRDFFKFWGHFFGKIIFALYISIPIFIHFNGEFLDQIY